MSLNDHMWFPRNLENDPAKVKAPAPPEPDNPGDDSELPEPHKGDK